MMQLGAPAEKIVMGLATYGHTFVMVDEPEGRPVFGSPISDTRIKAEFTGEEGFIGFNEVLFLHTEIVSTM